MYHRVGGTAERPTKVAILPVGHADGYFRSSAGSGRVWFDGAFRPVLGSVSMDLLAVDVTGCEAVIGKSQRERRHAPCKCRDCND